jgi:hypothetical protein
MFGVVVGYLILGLLVGCLFGLVRFPERRFSAAFPMLLIILSFMVIWYSSPIFRWLTVLLILGPLLAFTVGLLTFGISKEDQKDLPGNT